MDSNKIPKSAILTETTGSLTLMAQSSDSVHGTLKEGSSGMTEPEIISSVRDRLSDKFSIEKMVLFGSRALGTNSEESDWDLLVIAKSTVPFIERQGLALLALGKRDYPLDLLLYTPEEAEAAARIPGSAVYWAEHHGRIVFGK